MFEKILDILFPPRCVTCKIWGSHWCATCIEHVKPILTEIVPDMYAITEFQGTLRDALHAFKYRGIKNIATPLAQILAQEGIHTLLQKNIIPDDVIIVSIPSHKGGMLRRRFNHLDVLLRTAILSKKLPNVLSYQPEILSKIFETPKQVEVKSRTLRRKNLDGAFVAQTSQDLSTKTILVIDDVITTGTTLSEGRKALRVLKPKKIICLALAHAPHK